MAIAANDYVGRNVRMRIGRESYIGVIEAADDQIITLISGDDPVAITLRTEAIDGIMAFINPIAEQ